MKIFDLYHDSVARIGLAQQTISTNTTTNGATIDRSGYKGLIFAVYGQTLTDGAYAVKIQESDDGSTWTDAAEDNVHGYGMAFAATDDDTVKRIGYRGSKQYARVAVVSTSVTAGGVFSALTVLASPDHSPVAAD